jgi:ketosteroid isomerase-like protein
MSRENVEIVRRSVELWDQGDLDSGLAFYDPDVEIDFTRFAGWPEAGVYRGVPEFRRLLTEWLGTWETHEATIDTILDAGDDRVLVLVSQRGRSRGSTAEVEISLGQIYTLRDGLIVGLDQYTNRAEALAAAGLQE